MTVAVLTVTSYTTNCDLTLVQSFFRDPNLRYITT